ncbi:ninjurin-B-like [Uranotaenia lowii]|uniref:ninjurin-B-like n=1 Tax=Uranotaenia lowii TaxID=190385 RepID=UPI002479E068|nr:ninjurin-B-like [Uranotaenia lowii]XP_055596556.1 ninjurin-B-like [Uranotaenia lowii]XP_055596557.1 ninjurin-B-like [Uranotaenia lowii]
MAKDSDSALELGIIDLPKQNTSKLVSTGTDAAIRDSSTSLMRSQSVTEIDGGGRRSRGQQTQSYDIHKGIAESAMDISLLTANANQLRLLITYNGRSKTYIACITLVIVSLVLQILVASGVIIIKSQPKSRRSTPIERLKIATSIGLTIITVINILVASLVVTQAEPDSNKN